MIFYDLKQEARRKTIGNVLARDNELARIARTLKRQFNNNIVIKGASGTGKTAVVEAFAYLADRKDISGFENTAIVKLDSAELKRLFVQPPADNSLHAAFKSLPYDCVVFIDDFQNIVPDNKFFEMANIFEPFFDRSDLRLIISIQDQAYPDLHKENPGFFQYFEEISLIENDAKETNLILNGLKPAFESEYGVKISPDSIKTIVELSKKVNSTKKMPLKAIHLLDEVLAHAKVGDLKEITQNEIQQVFSEKTGIPAETLNDADTKILKNLESELSASVVGQTKAVNLVSDVVKRSRMGLRNPHRPYGSFLFLGPSGVGKTELSKALAKIVYGSERAFTRIDMSEFTEAHTVQRLIGAPPGYIGYEAGGQLTNAIKEQPYSLVLLDEIEKANTKVFDIFLQVFDDGRLSDGQGQTINFTNSIIIATSNLGIEEIVRAYESQPETDLNSLTFLEKVMMPILVKNFRMEFLNRFDAIIVFNPLSNEDLLKIAMLEIKKVEQRTAQHSIKFNIDPNILGNKVKQLTDYRFGARPVKRFIEQTCEGLVAAKILSSK